MNLTKKKVIIVSEFFAPQNEVAAIRLTKIAKYLHKSFNCEIIVVTREKNNKITDILLEKDASNVSQLIKISGNNILLKLMKFRKRIKSSKISKTTDIYQKINKKRSFIRVHKIHFYNLIFAVSYYYNAIRLIKNQKLEYDVIISSFGPMSSHFIGRFLKKKNPNAIWIADFRDSIYTPDSPYLFRYFYKRFAGKVCFIANYVSAVSDGVLTSLNVHEKIKKIVIPNGFDPDDINRIDSRKIRTDKFIITYTGYLYIEKRDLKPVFQAIYELLQEGLIKSDLLLFNYAGNSSQLFIEQMNKYNLNKYAVDYGFVSREKAIELQKNSSLLLLASWNKKNSTGVITGKFYEYLMMNKPIVCSISGNIANSELKSMISSANIGFTYEEANKNEDFEALKKFILRIYEDFLNGVEPLIVPNKTYIDTFNYKNIANQFNLLFK